MTPDAPGELPSPANLKVLKVQDELEESVTEVCQYVVEMGRVDIRAWIFEDGSPKLALVQA